MTSCVLNLFCAGNLCEVRIRIIGFQYYDISGV